MALVDYRLYGSGPVASEWAERIASNLPPEARLDLAVVRAVLVHGFVLRDAFLRLPEDPADWSGLRQTLLGWGPAEWRAIIAEGCRSNIQYAGDEVPEGWDRDEASFLATADAVAAEWNAGDRPRLRRLASNPDCFGAVVVDLLGAIWAAGAQDAWAQESPRLALARDAAAARPAGEDSHLPVGVLVGQITGRRPPEDWQTGWDGVRQLWLLPCFGMGEFLSLGRDGTTASVAYEPPANPGTRRSPAVGPSDRALDAQALQALSAAVRMGVWEALCQRGEMYGGEIAAMCGAGASAVSRVMGPLEQAGLVHVRRVGPAKFFAIHVGALAALLERLRPR